MLDKALSYNAARKEANLEGLKDFLRIPSVSTLKQHKPDIARAANFVVDQLRSMGFNAVDLIPGTESENPLIKGEWLGAPGKQTVLLYAHYDVQPVDPLNLWTSPPFEPTVRDGRLFARGSSDDKGQLWILLKSLESYMKTSGSLPVNVKILFEGEEEIGCTHITRYVESKPSYLDDVTSFVVLDSGFYAQGIPSITTGLRGMVKANLTVRTGTQDLHSGLYGGAAPNPLHALAKIIGELTTATGRVRIPGFYKSVLKPSKAELESWSKLPFDETEFRNKLGAKKLIGDRRYSVMHRLWAHPTLDVNGMIGGFTGDGFKTVIPAEASAKVSMRLVPGMDPEATAELFKRYVQSITPDYATCDVQILDTAPAMLVDTSDKSCDAAAKAFKETFKADVAYIRIGGSIPIAASFQSVLSKPVLVTGFVLPDCQAHAPNENLLIENMYGGIDAMTRYFDNLSK